LDGCGKQLRRTRLLLEHPAAYYATLDGKTAAALRSTDLADSLARFTGLAVVWWAPSRPAAAAGLEGADAEAVSRLSASPRLWDRGRPADACQGRRGERTTAQLRVSGNGSFRTTGMSW
jgi:hypothetical protein